MKSELFSHLSWIENQVSGQIDPADQRHFFYEEMKRLFYAMREVEPEDLDDEVIERFMAVADEMSNVLHSIDLKRRRREAKTIKFAL